MTDRFRYVALYKRPDSEVWHPSDVFETWGNAVECVRQLKRDGMLLHCLIEIDTYPMPAPPRDVADVALRHAGFERVPYWTDYTDGPDVIQYHDDGFWRQD